MILAQLLTGLALFMIAGDFSAMQGRWAHELGIPLSGFARWSFWLVPIAVLLSLVLPRRIPAWRRVVVCDLVALGIVVLPMAVLSFGSRSVTFPGAPPSRLTEQLRSELGFPVVIASGSPGYRIYFPRAHDRSQVRDALHRHKIETDA